MSIASIFANGLAGLGAAQAGVRVVSQNIANINTPGYVRTEMQQTARTLGQYGSGVEITGFQRAVDELLARSAITATARAGAADARADLLDRAQLLFGDPTTSGSLFARLNDAFSQMTELSSTPSNALRRQATVSAFQSLLSQMSSVSQGIEALRVEAEQRLNEQAQTASALMSQISDLNSQIRVIRSGGGDATSAENAQAQMIEQLSSYMDIRVSARSDNLGGVEIRTGAGALLVGVNAGAITYNTQGVPFAVGGRLNLVDSNGVATPLEGLLREGSMKGLLDARDTDLPQLSDSLGAFAGVFADQVNAVHNLNTSVPAPASMTGRNTGLVGTDALNFTGRATVAITNSAGVMTHTLEIDFTNGTYSLDGAAAVSYGGPTATVAQFVSGIDGALTGIADMTFTNGVMNISANGSGNGIVIKQDATTPSTNGSRGFSHYFGLNDLITRNQPVFFTPSMVTPAHNLNPGGAVSFRVTDATGRVMMERSVGVTGANWTDMVTALNDGNSGLPAAYGAFGYSSGRITLSPASGYKVEIVNDTTTRGTTGLSMSALFGLDRYARAGRATDLSVNSAIVANPGRLALAQPDISTGLNSTILEAGDARGATALLDVQDRVINFGSVGVMSAQSVTLSSYLSALGGEIGRRATDAENTSAAAASVAQIAAEQRSSVEGVKLDDELVRMTQYQQSYAAASRLIQAAKEMMDTLLSLK